MGELDVTGLSVGVRIALPRNTWPWHCSDRFRAIVDVVATPSASSGDRWQSVSTLGVYEKKGACWHGSRIGQARKSIRYPFEMIRKIGYNLSRRTGYESYRKRAPERSSKGRLLAFARLRIHAPATCAGACMKSSPSTSDAIAVPLQASLI
jgi:hypothetical protein